MTSDQIAKALQKLKGKPIIIASHPRSGTHITIDLFRRQFAECQSWKYWGENTNRLYLSVEALYLGGGRTPISEATAVAVLRRVPRPLVKTHLLFADIPVGEATKPGCLGRYWMTILNQRTRLAYVYRDGRSVMCSHQVFKMRVDPQARGSIGQFIRQNEGGVSRAKAWANHVRTSLAYPHVVPIRCEDLIADTAAMIDRLARDFDLTPLHRAPLMPAKLRNTWHGRLVHLFGVRPESTALLGRYKGQSPAKWQTAFTREDRQFFWDEAGDMLAELGYESSDAWIDQGG